MTRGYVIRLFDRPLVAYSVGTSAIGGVTGKVEWVDEESRALLPPRLLQSCAYEDVEAWLASRVIPKNRAFVRQILWQYGIGASNPQDIIDVSRGLSLNDAYWVTPDGFDGTWAECNLYENRFDEVLGLVAYTGVTGSQRRKAGLSSEWTTSGSYPKAWRNVGGRIVLYKAGNYPLYEGCANEDLGPFSEYFSVQVAERAGLPHVEYGLDVWEGHLASTCELFCDERHSYVSFYEATNRSGVPSCLAACESLGPSALERYLDMLTFDSVILNDDRHVGNFGFMRDNETGRFLGFAPLFDQNRSLFPTDMDEDLAGWQDHARGVAPAGSAIPFDSLMPTLITGRQHEWLRRLLDFSPTQDEAHRVSERRLEAIGRLVRERASEMLRLPCHDLSEVRAVIRASYAPREGDDAEMPIVTQSMLCRLDVRDVRPAR